MPSGSSKPTAAVYSKENGLSWGFVSDAGKVYLAGSSAGVVVKVALGAASDTVASAFTNLTTSTNKTVSLVGAPGASTAIQLRGFSVGNYGTNKVIVELKFGATSFWREELPGGSKGGAAFNWNMIGMYKQATNKKLVAYHSGASTTVWSVFYKLV